MKLSIIIPVYNTAEYLNECLDSVFAQTIKDFEVIAIDDGFTGDSLMVLQSFAETHSNMLIKSIENTGGPGRPRNIGINLSKGRYIFFMDSDDVLEKDAMHNACNIADETGSDIIILKQESFGIKSVGVARLPYEKQIIKGDFVKTLAYTTLGVWKLFRSSLIKDNNITFVEVLFSGQDQPFALESYYLSNHVSSLNDKVYYWMRSRPDVNNSSFHGKKNTRRYKKSPRQIWHKVHECLKVIDKYSSEGAFRDKVLLRQFSSKGGG